MHKCINANVQRSNAKKKKKVKERTEAKVNDNIIHI